MALDRVDFDARLVAYLDDVTPIPDHIAERYRAHADHPTPEMMTHPELGRLLMVLTRATGGGRVLEIGTFVGISAAWIAEGLAPEGRLDSLELDPARAADAGRWLGEVTGGRVTVHAGPALDTLPLLEDGAYDLCYIDADKTGYPAQLVHASRLVRTGGLIVADNVLAQGRVADPAADDPAVVAIRAFTEAALTDDGLATVVAGIGDGVTVSVRL